MESLFQRLERAGFSVALNPRGDGKCFFSAAAFQLGLEMESLKAVVFNYLQEHRFDVSINSKRDSPPNYILELRRGKGGFYFATPFIFILVPGRVM